VGLCFGEFYGFSHEFRQEEMTANKAYNANKDKERKKITMTEVQFLHINHA